MAGIGDIVKDVRTRHTWWLNYPPGSPIRLGDVIVREQGVWVVVGNVQDDLGISVDREEDPVPHDPWVLTSEGTITIEGKAAGELSEAVKFLADGKAGVQVKFTNARQYLLSLSDVSFPRVASLAGLWSEIKESRYNRWTWDLRKRIVTHTVEAGSGTFLTSAAGTNTFELEAEADVKAGPVPAADVSAGFKLVSAFTSSEQFASRTEVTPLFRCAKVRVLAPGLELAAIGDGDFDLVEDAETDDVA